MPHTVYIDRTEYWEVIADYSGSPRHANLTEAAWRSEYETNPSYARMRTSFPGSVAGITPKGVGKWLKDWSGPYVAASEPAPPEPTKPQAAYDAVLAGTATLADVVEILAYLIKSGKI